MDTPTSRDLSRPAATNDDTDFTLSLDEVAQLYEKAGHARTLRTLQRYCASGHLEAQKIATTLGDKYLVTPQSVARHIAQIAELAALDSVAASRDPSRPVATAVAHQQSQQIDEPLATTGSDVPRQGPTWGDMSRSVAADLDVYEHPYVKRLEGQVEKLEGKLEAQVRRTEEIQQRAQDKLVELQRMTTIGQSKTLADFMLQAKNWIVGADAEDATARQEEGKS